MACFMKTIDPVKSVRLACWLAVVAGFGLAGAGCTQVQVAPGVMGEYKLGELQVLADHDFKHVYEATKAGMKDFGLFQTQDDRKVIEAELKGRDTTDTIVIVKIKEIGANRTSLKIRYGVNPQRLLAEKLYQAIQKRM